jgi:hypothetical protein
VSRARRAAGAGGALVLVVVALALAGCGSSSLSAGDLRKQAGDLCATASRQANRIPVPQTPSGGAGFVNRGIAVIRPELVKLRLLKPPKELADTWKQSISAYADMLGALESTSRSLRAGANPVEAIQDLQRKLEPLETKGNTAWQAMQIPACVST